MMNNRPTYMTAGVLFFSGPPDPEGPDLRREEGRVQRGIERA